MILVFQVQKKYIKKQGGAWDVKMINLACQGKKKPL